MLSNYTSDLQSVDYGFDCLLKKNNQMKYLTTCTHRPAWSAQSGYNMAFDTAPLNSDIPAKLYYKKHALSHTCIDYSVHRIP